MSIVFKSMQSNKGFFLEEKFVLKGQVAVLTGRNGAGKTRFLEGMKNCIEVKDGDRYVPQENIQFVPVREMQGDFVSKYTEESNIGRLKDVVNCFRNNKEKFSSPYDPRNVIHHGAALSYSFEELYQSFDLIAKRLSKSVWDLQDEEIRSYFESPLNMKHGLDIGWVCNEYLRRSRNNLFSMWLAKDCGRDISFLNPAEFVSRFGGAPWELYNSILKEIFDGKILIDPPCDELSEEVFHPILRNAETGHPVPLDGLSSGEKSLVWLANAMFKLKYRSHSTSGIPEILLLDEPDAFLHPKMVVKFYSVIELLASALDCRVIFTTHSPTTVALAPDDCIYIVSCNKISLVEKDEAIAELLDGVTQISLNARNRREVFVESKADADVYEYIFNKIKSHFPKIDQKISLSFLVAGPKMPSNQIEVKLKQCFGVVDEHVLQQFVNELNGVGDCGQVIAMVESLTTAGNTTVRGVIDWDSKNKSEGNIVVSGFGVFYTIENIILNPIYLIKALNAHNHHIFPLEKYCGVDVSLQEWKGDWLLLQHSVDTFLGDFMGRPSLGDVDVKFLGGNVLKMDSEYLKTNGHDLMRRVLDKYKPLMAFNKKGSLLFTLTRVMVDDFGWEYVPECFGQTFSALQANG
ncbi:ATP-binding protein [Pseudomonas moraviensis]|uniref:ATP-binding protein n=1 Tax=Pseudomonas moraviensis TaxID=321662 RepID=UPI00215EF852|nr:ATP-binding protein [Pseudomonas moraviensis]UVL48263.1 ATP-binding protein [Pseudomonas moraviensis]